MTCETALFFSPRSASEGAGVFRACSAAAASGRAIRVGIVESPFRPADGVALPAAPSQVRDIEAPGAQETLALAGHGGMSGIEEISRSDLLAVAGGGARFGAFAEAVRDAGLYFPHEPEPLTRDATIAELIMGAEAFPTDGRFGNLREYVLSLEIVTPGGEIIRTGSRSVKDVTGYNIAGILMGSGGRCGMIAKATLRLLPPPGTRLLFLCAGSRPALTALAGEIHARLAPAFLEMFSGPEGPADAASLVGELQSAVREREGALFDAVSALGREAGSVERLEPARLEAYRRPPVPRHGGGKANGGGALVRAALGRELAPGGGLDAWSRRSFFPARFHYYFRSDSSVAPELRATGKDCVVESIEIRGGAPFRRRLERVDAAAGGARPAAPGGYAAGELDRNVYRVFDPEGIMLP